MFQVLFAAGGLRLGNLDVWYALPAICAVSLVYAATRHEQMRPIFIHAGRVALWIVGFMLIVFVALQLLAWRA